MRIAYVTDDQSDAFSWYAVNDGEEGLIHDAIRTDYDSEPDVVIMSVDEASEMVDDIPFLTVVPGTIEKFYYGS